MLKTINGGQMATKGTKHSACVDLYANADCTIYNGTTVKVPLGVAIDEELMLTTLRAMHPDEVEPESNYYLVVEPRSSLRLKGLIAGSGIIDMDYISSEINIILQYNGDKPFEIKKGDRIAQVTVLKHFVHLLGVTTDEERSGGFGSTGQ